MLICLATLLSKNHYQNHRRRNDCSGTTHWDWIEEFQNVLWSDESKFETFGIKKRNFVQLYAGEKMLPDWMVMTVKHGGRSVMAGGCFSGYGTGVLLWLQGIMKKNIKWFLKQMPTPDG